jgi:hypothetical protein
MQEDKTQSFDLANYGREQYAAYLKGGKTQPVDDDIPFFALPNSCAMPRHGMKGIKASATPSRTG